MKEFWKRLKFFDLRKGTRQAEMLAFPFAAAREPAKLAKRVLSGLWGTESLILCKKNRAFSNAGVIVKKREGGLHLLTGVIWMR